MRRSTIIAVVATVVLLSAGIAALTLWPDSGPEPDPIETQTPQPDAFAELVNVSREDVRSIYFYPLDGVEYSLHYDAENEEIELDAADRIFPGNADVMDSIFTRATILVTLTKVTDEADDTQLTMFGFDEPVMSYCVERIDGTLIEVEVGAIQAIGQGRYARLQNSREILLLSGFQSSMLTLQLEDVYDLTFIPIFDYPEEDIVLDAIESVLLETDNDIFDLQKRTEEEMLEVTLGSSSFKLLQPIEAEGNDHMIRTLILEHIIYIIPSSIEAVRPDDLSIYGLDTPARLTVAARTVTDEGWSDEVWSGTLLIGDRNAERGGRYVMIEGYDAVLFDTQGDYSFLNVRLSQLRSRLIWLHSIDNVSSVRYDLDGVTRTLRISHPENDDETIQGWLDDVELNVTNTRRLYVGSLMINQDGETSEPIPTDILPQYRITMNFIDGGSEMLELFQISESQFLITHNGISTGFFMTRMALQQGLLDRFDIIDAGGEIPM